MDWNKAFDDADVDKDGCCTSEEYIGWLTKKHEAGEDCSEEHAQKFITHTEYIVDQTVRLYQGTLRKHYMNPFAHMPITCMDVTRKYYACAIEYYKECVNVKALYYYYYYYYSI